MAVTTNLYTYPDFVTSYVGCVIRWYEINGYHDSDWYAEVWDEETQSIKTVEFNTTRAGGGGHAEIDITPDNLRKVYNSYRKTTVSWLDEENARIAKTPQKGKVCTVTRGVKVPIGTIGEVFWIGECSYNRHVMRAGIKSADGAKHFVPIDYLEVVNNEQYIVHGKERKEVIKRALIKKIPKYLRDRLNPQNQITGA